MCDDAKHFNLVTSKTLIREEKRKMDLWVFEYTKPYLLNQSDTRYDTFLVLF
jgi:hypothetical protein